MAKKKKILTGHNSKQPDLYPSNLIVQILFYKLIGTALTSGPYFI